MSTIEEGDEVIIPAPYWVSYPDIVSLCSGKPVIPSTSMSKEFKITSDLLKSSISEKTKWFVLNSPCNPTGSVYSENELESLASVLVDNPHVNILSDDIYEHIIYGKERKFINILNVEPKLYERTFIVNGVSKVFSMTGWRIGYGAGNEQIIKSISKIQSQSTTNPCSISQMAAKYALDSNKKFLIEWINKFEQRKNYLIKFFKSIDGFDVYDPSGAFYLFVGCKGFIDKKKPDGKFIKNDIDFSEYILMDAKVAIVPGIAFGKSPYFRISYATSLDDLKEACNKIHKSITKLI
jgi:aspartate aminotransferase